MIKYMFWSMLLSAGFMWYSVTHMPVNGQFQKQSALTAMMTLSNQSYKKFKATDFKNAKLSFAGYEIPLNLNKESLTEYIKAEPRAQRALFVFGLFMLNVWLVPLIGGAKQRRLKQELFDLHPELIVNNMSESRETPYYSSTFFDRLLYMLYPGLFLIAFSFVSSAVTLALVVGLVVYAMFSYHLRTQKYQSVENFHIALSQGTGLLSVFKQVISFFRPEPQKRALDKTYQEALAQAKKNQSDRKAS